MTSPLRIATRRSPLALWQAEHVRSRLQAAHPRLVVELVSMTTEGDRRLAASLAAVGGKGLFVKELEQAMLDGRADIAVHSMKDVPAAFPPGLQLAVCLCGDDPRDAFVSNRYDSLDAMPADAVVGTASLRRQAQLRHLRPDLGVIEVRGNVGSRLKRLDEGRCDALLLAHAGLSRLGLGDRIRESFDVARFVPAIAQGVIGVECRSDDPHTRCLLSALHHPTTDKRVAAERRLSARLGGACTVPVAGHAIVSGGRIRLTGLVAAPDGRRIVRASAEGRASSGVRLAENLADQLLAAGAREILAALGINT